MSDETVILKEIVKMHDAINKSFEKVYTEIGDKFSDCDKRVSEIERAIAIRKALCKKEKDDKKEKKDYWIPVLRAVNIAGILALLTIAWEAFKKIWGIVE